MKKLLCISIPLLCAVGLIAAETHSSNTCEFRNYKRDAIACQIHLDEKIEIKQMAAISSVVTHCVTSPVILLSDGKQNILFWLSTDKDEWHSSRDPIAGLHTVFTKGLLAMSLEDEGTCISPPEHLHVSFVYGPPTIRNK